MDTAPLSTRRQLELMQQLQELADERAAAERTIEETRQAELTASQEQHDTSTEKLLKQCSQRRRELENEYSEAKRAADQRLRDTTNVRQEHHQQQIKRIQDKSKQIVLAIERRKKESEWQALAVFDAGKDLPGQKRNETAHRLQARVSQIEGLQRDANTLIAMRRLTQRAKNHQAINSQLPPEQDENGQDLETQLQTAINQAHQAVLDLQSQRLPALMLENWRWAGWWGVASLLVAPLVFLADFHWWSPLAVIAGGGALTAICYFIVGGRARRQSLDQFVIVTKLLQRARHWQLQTQQQDEALCRQETDAITSSRDIDLRAAETLREAALMELDQMRATELYQAQQTLDSALEEATSECAAAQTTAEKNFPPLLDQLAKQRTDELQAIDQQHQQQTSSALQKHETQWKAMAQRWHTGFESVAEELGQMCDKCQRYFPNWSKTKWDQWPRPEQPRPLMESR